MPQWLQDYLAALDAEKAQTVWDWADSSPDVANQIIDIVAPIAAPDAAEDVREVY